MKQARAGAAEEKPVLGCGVSISIEIASATKTVGIRIGRRHVRGMWVRLLKYPNLTSTPYHSINQPYTNTYRHPSLYPFLLSQMPAAPSHPPDNDNGHMPPPPRYIVIGAGPAGCALAAALAEEQEEAVVLLEMGPDWVGYLCVLGLWWCVDG